MTRLAHLERGFAIVVALVIFILGIVLVSFLFALGSMESEDVHRAQAEQIAQRAAESGIRTAMDRLGENISRSFFSDPAEAYYWHGGDIPDPLVGANGDGVIANDGEVFDRDYGPDNLPDSLEPRFFTTNDPALPATWGFATDLDPSGDDFNPGGAPAGNPAGPGLITEGNRRFDPPLQTVVGLQSRSQLFAVAPGANNLSQVGGASLDLATGPDQRSSFAETKPVFIPGNSINIPYDPITNPDPAGDDYHPIFNPNGLEGRVINPNLPPFPGFYQGPTVENPDTRWRRYLHREGGVGEFGDGTLQGFTSVRAIDTSTKIDINGPSLLTARLLDGLVQMTAVSPGPITPFNAAIGNNGRGIEWEPMPVLVNPPDPLANPANWTSLYLDAPQSFLMPNPAFNAFGTQIASFVGVTVGNTLQAYQTWVQNTLSNNPALFSPPRKIASTQAEEENYFHQPVSAIDPDVVAIIKYRNRLLGGRFTSLTQLLEVRRSNGDLIFDQRSRDELSRLMEFVTIEAWRDPNGVVHRNGEPLLPTVALETQDPSLPLGNQVLSSYATIAPPALDPLVGQVYHSQLAPEAEPWQDIFQNNTCDNKERLNPNVDRGLQQYQDTLRLNPLKDCNPGNVNDYYNSAGVAPPVLPNIAWHMEIGLSDGSQYVLYPYFCHDRDTNGDGSLDDPGEPTTNYDVVDGASYVKGDNKIFVDINHPAGRVCMDGTAGCEPGYSDPLGRTLTRLKICASLKTNYRGHFTIYLSKNFTPTEIPPAGSTLLFYPIIIDTTYDVDGVTPLSSERRAFYSTSSAPPIWRQEGNWTEDIDFCREWTVGGDQLDPNYLDISNFGNQFNYCNCWQANHPSMADLPTLPADNCIPPQNFTPLLYGKFFLSVVHANPSRWKSEEDPIWNPFFIRRFTGAGGRNWRVDSAKSSLSGWSPFSNRFYSANPLPHRHSSYNFPIPNTLNPQFPAPGSYDAAAISYPLTQFSGLWDHKIGVNEPVLFNFDASQKNGLLDVDHYVSLFEPKTVNDRERMFSELSNWVPAVGEIAFDDQGRDLSFGILESRSSRAFRQYSVPSVGTDYIEDNFNSAGTPTQVGLDCGGNPVFRMVNSSGWEGNSRFDLIPEMYNPVTPDPLGFPVNILDPHWQFSLLNTGFQFPINDETPAVPDDSGLDGLNPVDVAGMTDLLIPEPARPNDNWFAEPGEPYFDHGRDGLPNTGDFGEGDGFWNPGESFRDVGLDGIADVSEIAFDSTALNNPVDNTACPNNPADLHGDNYRVVNGRVQGTEGNRLFDLLSEPYFDLDGNGVHTHSPYSSMQLESFNDLNGNGVWDPAPPLPAQPEPLIVDLDGDNQYDPPSTPRALTYIDSNGNGVYDRGIYRESRAPINLNAAPEEVLAAVIYQGLIMPTKKRIDRFQVISMDLGPGGVWADDDFDWSSVAQNNFATPQFNRSNLFFAQDLARGLARAIFLRRLGLYPAGSPGIGAGPFQNWQEFDLFIRTVIGTAAETAKFAGFTPWGTRIAGGLLGDPFGGAPPLPSRQITIDRILTQLIPNELSSTNSGSFIPQSRFTKEDFPYPTTELCLGPTGVYEITAVGYAVSGGPVLNQLNQNQIQDVAIGNVLANPDALSSRKVSARVEVQKTVKVFDVQKLSSREDFEASNSQGRGVTVFPSSKDNSKITMESSVTLEEMLGPSDLARPNLSTQSTSEPFLLVRPSVTAFDSKRGLLFVANNNGPTVLAQNSAYTPGVTNPGGIVQVFEFAPGKEEARQSPLRNVPSNNGNRWTVTEPGGNSYSFGIIQSGSGFTGGGPTIAAMSFDPNFPLPSNFPGQYLGRLYLLDNAPPSLRAVDIGKDASGGMVSSEVFLTAAAVTNPGGFTRARALVLAPDRREVFALWSAAGTGNLVVQRLRYSEDPQFPEILPTGANAFGSIEVSGAMAMNSNNNPCFMSYDSSDQSLYVAATDSATMQGRLFKFDVRNALGVPTTPFPALSAAGGFVNFPPGFGVLSTLNNVVIRQIVGLELDSVSGLLFILWNCTNNLVHDGNGRGAYIAAFPTGASSYISAPLANPLPMEFTTDEGPVYPLFDGNNNAAVDDQTDWINAAGFALDPIQKTLLIAPQETRCSAGNPYAPFKIRLRAMSYAGDGLRIIDLLNSARLWTIAGQVPVVTVRAFPGTGMFFLSSAPLVNVTREAVPSPPPLPTEFFGTAPACDAGVASSVSRSVRVFQVKGFGFQNGESKDSVLSDGKLKASENAPPLSVYLPVVNPPVPWIHSRANFDGSRFFVQPQYLLGANAINAPPIATGPRIPLGVRPIFNTKGTVPPGVEAITVDSTAPVITRSDNGEETIPRFQGHQFPQPAIDALRELRGAYDSVPSNSIENGWKALSGSTEFWFRLNQAPNAPPAQIVLWEHFSSVKANPYAFLPADPADRHQALFNILKAAETYLGGLPLPVGANATDIANFQFAPDAIDLWVYDKIVLTNYNLAAGTADIHYERRLAAPVGNYPSIVHPWRAQAQLSTAWGDYQGVPGLNFRQFEPYNLYDTFYLAHPFEPDVDENVVRDGDLMDSNRQEWRHGLVKVDWDLDAAAGFDDPQPDGHDGDFEIDGGEDFTHAYRFVPIWSNGVPLGAGIGRQAAVRATVAGVPMRAGQWLRIGYTSNIDYDPGAGVATALMRPSLAQTVLKIWSDTGYGSAAAGVINAAAELGWHRFPTSDGFLSFGGYAMPYQPGGSVVPGLSYTVDDIVFYERPEPVLNANANTPFTRNEIGEGGAAFPGGINPPYLAAEPFCDFDNDGVRDDGLAGPLSFWDFNANQRWDFGEPRGVAGEDPRVLTSNGLLPDVGRIFFGEPYVDLNSNGGHDPITPLFFDLNNNGVLDGEGFVDANGNLIHDAGEAVVNDLNANGLYDGGEPVFVCPTPGNCSGEPYSDLNTNGEHDANEPFQDENGNGFWDPGEPFVSWSQNNAPTGGELYRENGLNPNWFDNHAPIFPLVSDWNGNGRYEPAGIFEGTFSKPIPAGSRLGSVHFTVWKPKRDTVAFIEPEEQGRVSVDLELRAKDGRFLGRWSGVDNLSLNAGVVQVVDESGIGLPVPVDAYVRYRINFYMPNPLTNPDTRRPSVSPILDDLSLNIVLPPAAQTVFEDRVVNEILVRDFERGNFVQ